MQSATTTATKGGTLGHRLVCRLVTPEGAQFPVQEYLRVDDPPEWTRKRTEAGLFSFEKSDRIARRLTSPEIYVYAALPQQRNEPAMPAQPRHDWHAAKPNCGVE